MPPHTQGVYASQAVPQALTLREFQAQGVNSVNVFAELATRIESALIDVLPVPHFASAIVEALHVHVVTVQRVVILLVPAQVDSAVFSTLHKPTSLFVTL